MTHTLLWFIVIAICIHSVLHMIYNLVLLSFEKPYLVTLLVCYLIEIFCHFLLCSLDFAKNVFNWIEIRGVRR